MSYYWFRVFDSLPPSAIRVVGGLREKFVPIDDGNSDYRAVMALVASGAVEIAEE